MADRIGPTFGAELAAAGCTTDLTWCADGTMSFGASATPAQQQAVLAVFAAHDPTKTFPPTVTGNQWAFALSSLSLSAAWQVGVTKSKSSDQVRVGLIARDTALLAADPLLIRVAANAGNDANGNPLIVVPTVFTTAQTMPL